MSSINEVKQVQGINMAEDSSNGSPKGTVEKKAPDIRRMPKGKNTPLITIFVTAIFSILLFVGWMFLSNYQPKGEEVGFGEIITDISEEEYDKIVLKDNEIILETEGKEGGSDSRKYAKVPPNTDLYQTLSDAGVDVTNLKELEYQPAMAISVMDIITIIFLGAGVVLVFVMIRNMQGQGGKIMDFGQSKARLIFGKKTGVSFEDVAGIDEVKEELVEVVDFLKNPKKYYNIGARIPRGVLLVGSPGTGKTLLAKAVAGEAGVPFFHTSGAEFEEMLVGAGASRVRDLFVKAKKASPCIIFIDEIDAVAKKRGTVLHSGAGEQTLNQILVEMDGLEGRENVIVLAATNRPDVLDPAILRPGRFDRTVVVHMPDVEGREQIIKVHAKGKKFEKDVDLDLIAKKTIGFSGADLENLINEAAIRAARDERKEVSQDDLFESLLKVSLGREKKRRRTEDDIKAVAYHEAGHAVVARFTPGSDPVEKVSIISRGMTGGVTVYVPQEDRTITTKTELEARLRAAVGGRIAEEIFMGDMSTGASNDIKQATELARVMVQKYGMNEKLGFVKYGNTEENDYLGYQYGGDKEYSEKTAELIDSEVKKMLDDAQADARKILEDNKKGVNELVKILLETEQVDKDDFDKIFLDEK